MKKMAFECLKKLFTNPMKYVGFYFILEQQYPLFNPAIIQCTSYITTKSHFTE